MNNPQANRLAINLFKYSFYRGGLSFAPYSFMHLASVAVQKAINKKIIYDDNSIEIINLVQKLNGIEDVIRTSNKDENFSLQYILNNIHDNTFVIPIMKDASYYNDFVTPRGEDETLTKEEREDKTRPKYRFADKVILNLSHESPATDKKIIKSEEQDSDGHYILNYMPFIKILVDGTYICYKLDEASMSNKKDSESVEGSNEVLYTRVEPLGNINNSFDYNPNKSVWEIKSPFNTSAEKIMNKTTTKSQQSRYEDSLAENREAIINEAFVKNKEYYKDEQMSVKPIKARTISRLDTLTAEDAPLDLSASQEAIDEYLRGSKNNNFDAFSIEEAKQIAQEQDVYNKKPC